MSVSELFHPVSKLAGVDLSGHQYRPVKRDTTKDQVVKAAAATDISAGIQIGVPQAAVGSPVEILEDGYTEAWVDGTVAIAIGDKLTPNASSNLIKTTTATNQVYAIAEEAATAVVRIRVKLLPPLTVV